MTNHKETQTAETAESAAHTPGTTRRRAAQADTGTCVYQSECHDGSPSVSKTSGRDWGRTDKPVKPLTPSRASRSRRWSARHVASPAAWLVGKARCRRRRFRASRGAAKALSSRRPPPRARCRRRHRGGLRGERAAARARRARAGGRRRGRLLRRRATRARSAGRRRGGRAGRSGAPPARCSPRGASRAARGPPN